MKNVTRVGQWKVGERRETLSQTESQPASHVVLTELLCVCISLVCTHASPSPPPPPHVSSVKVKGTKVRSPCSLIYETWMWHIHFVSLSDVIFILTWLSRKILMIICNHKWRIYAFDRLTCPFKVSAKTRHLLTYYLIGLPVLLQEGKLFLIL